MGSPPIPDRGPTRRSVSPTSRPPGFRNRSPPRPHPGIRPAAAPASVPFVPPKRRTGGSIKGKERASEGLEGDDDDEDERGPATRDAAFPPQAMPTYRHLLGSNNGGAAAAMEMSRLGIPETQPMAVQQWNGLIAVNYPARAYGITRHETPAEALKKCPMLRLVHVQTYKNGETEPGYWDGAKPETHKVSLDMYRKESRKIVEVFSEFCPVVEKASIDESYLDLTLPVRELLLKKYPALATAPSGNLDEPLPPPSSLGVNETDYRWDEVGNLIPISGQKKEKVKRLDPTGAPMPSSSSPAKPAVDAATSDSTLDIPAAAATSAAAAASEDDSPTPDPPEPPLTWSDVCLYLGASLVRDIRAIVRERLGYTCSAGIATNKMLAKLCAGWKKPNAQTILRHCAVPAFLRPMPFQKIRNLGGKLGTAVKETYEANTVSDLLDFTLPELKAKLGEASGTWLWEIVRGLDYTEVDTKTQVKSMLSSKNFRPSISTYGEVPKTITFTHRSPSFVIRSHQAPFPFTSSLSIAYILKHGEKLLRVALGASIATASAHNAGAISDASPVGPYSNIQLSFSGLERLEDGQRGIEGFFAAQKARQGPAAASSAAAGSAGRKSREPSAGPARPDAGIAADETKPAPAGTKRKKPSTSRPRSRSPAVTIQPDGTETLDLVSSSSASEVEDPPPTAGAPRRAKKKARVTATCERCGKELAADAGGADEALERVKAEHADWHVARDLLERERKKGGWGFTAGGSSSSSSLDSATGTGPVRKKKTARLDDSSEKDRVDASTGRGGKKQNKKERGTLNGFLVKRD
ncbi:hypothetical protein Rhopal_003943-T1 [Rhodotorula paludigena]|uniref:Uncharacterized protein n=1 Tax=Rhodotorula paludigena TaxID=86838 RepID=A0AAV5GLY7_9BASI|nr:hypothetical protein Rhopal_003943-T1 [Rhodotorula paludigena]